MGSLRDLLNKQKAETERKLSNGPTVAKSVLQSQPVEAEKATAVQEEKSRPESVPDIGSESEESNKRIQIGSAAQPPVVEQRPLSAIERIRAAKAAKATNSGVNAISEKKADEKSNTIIPSKEPIASTSSVASDAGNSSKIDAHLPKGNDGVIDTSELKRNLEYLANNIEQKELVGQVVRTIALQLKNSPELTPYMTDADVDLVVRGLRRSYSIVARKKSEAAEKRKGFGKNNDELNAMFKDAGLDGLDLGLK